MSLTGENSCNGTYIVVTLSDVNDTAGHHSDSVPGPEMGLLVGDTNSDAFVNSGDSLQTRNRSGQTTDAINFRSDVNVDGFVNSGDRFIVRSRSGGFLP